MISDALVALRLLPLPGKSTRRLNHTKEVCVTAAAKSVLRSEEALRRVRGEFLEMPGLRLSEPQARRLWGLDEDECARVLAALIEMNFLFKTRDGAFMRRDGAFVKMEQPQRAPATSRRRVDMRVA
jgi:hypothetical protein